MSKKRPGTLHAAVLGLTHPHSGKLLQTLENLPEIGGISLWENVAGAARTSKIPRSAKVGLVARELDAVLQQPDLDFAIVCVCTDEAEEVALHVIQAGKHLLAEKPVGLTSVGIRRIQRAADAARVRASVLYVRRAHPAIQYARRLLGDATLGPLLSVEGRLLTTQVRFRKPLSWLFQRRRAGGGILTWLGCHYLDLMHYVSGDEISSVGACMARRNGQRIDVEDTAAVMLQFRSGAVGTFHAGYALAHSGGGYTNSQGYDAYLAWNAREGRVVWPSLTRPDLHVEGAGRPLVRDMQFPLATSTSYGGACGDAFMRQFIGVLREGGELPATLTDALRTALVIEACQNSAQTGRQVRVPRTR